MTAMTYAPHAHVFYPLSIGVLLVGSQNQNPKPNPWRESLVSA